MSTIKNFQINNEIKDAEVRLIGEDGILTDVIKTKEAMEIATQRNLDLVKMPGKADPPVCKVIDYGKYCFERAKKIKEEKKNQKNLETKEIHLSFNIGTGDLKTKALHACKFIENGNKVKVVIRLKGREIVHSNIAYEVIDKFYEMCSEVAEKNGEIISDGRHIIMNLTKKK
ncbi:MAG: translation initiation factor IF-3 [Candidatus Improbicoccus pseudotrichonymphae]|uniref:Translation initiation factor IF-3 n=1 Tax=Candidatus Improbicoccus pseudotrichonymphae TaxID=3033792 RepID=A0AA48HXS8_9FIRM|nr:MAG: translation initiation factor IF-3 [Candidatus Improbicoccus pseudotrichonymphae]